MPLKNDWQNGDLFTPAAANDMANAVNSVVAVTVSRFLPGAASNQAAIAAAIADAGVNGVVDFEGISYVTTGTVTVSTAGVTLQNGGIRPTGQFQALAVNAADVTVQGMKFSRSTSAPFTASIADRSCVSVNGARFSSIDCDYLGSAGACVFISHGTCDGTVIRGGQMTGTPSFQDACGVYAAAGATGNRNITIEGVHIYDTTHGVHLFDTAESLIAGNRVESCRMVETIALTGWTLVSGNVYRQRTATGSTPGTDGPSTDRAEGNTNTVYNNGVHMGEVTQGSATPSSNRASVSGGYVYINLAGTNPNTRTITGGIVTGYALMLYMSEAMQATPEVISGNRIVDNYCDDIDGYGVYLQFSVNGGAYGNQVTGNHLKNVCLEGAQNPSLPFGGIGVVGGTDTVLANNTIDGVGSAGKTVPGVYIYQGSTNTDSSGRMIGMSVRGSLNVGYRIRASNWIISGCRADDNDNHGFFIAETDSGAKIEAVTLSGCVAQNNTGVGFYVDGTSTAISNISVNIIGGASIGNGNRGIQISGSASTTTVTNCSVIGVLAKENGTSSQQIILSGAANDITVAGCHMVHSAASTGLYVAASVTNAVAFGNQFDISTPRTYLATVASGFEDSTTAALGIGTLNLGHASDTTLSRSAAGVLAVQGVNVLLNGGALGTPSSGTLTNCTFPTLNQNTSGTSAGLSATLVVGSGGTGVTSLTGLVKGNGSSAMTAAVAGTDFVAPGGALGTPSSATLTNATGLPSSGISDSTSVGRSVLTAASESAARTAIGASPVTDVQVFTTAGTWTKPAGALSVHVRLIGPGGGGGAGARGPSGTALSGGGGGGGGALSQMTFDAADLPATVSVNVPAGGAGATGQTSDGTAGATGSASATSTTFGAHLVAQRAGGGVGGGLAVAGTGGGGGAGMFNGVIGAAGSAAGAVGANGGTGTASAGGGAGGGITTGGTANAGGTGGLCNPVGLAAGVAGNGANGGAGASSTVKGAAPGGGGGGANASGAGYNGGNGGLYGAGGGGGGASLNGSTSGAGGNGGDGIAIVTTYF